VAVLLDTAQLPLSERRDAVTSTVVAGGVLSRVTLEDGEPVSARICVWEFGTAAIFQLESSGISVVRTAQAVRQGPCEFVAIAQHGVGSGQLTTESTSRTVRSGQTELCDVTQPFEYSWRGSGGTRTLQVSVDELAVPIDVVRRAGEHLASSPLYGLVSRHIYDMANDAEALSATAVAGSLGTASTELIRALILSAGGASPAAREVLEQTLITQVRAYVRQHLRDPDLGPDAIAAALAISTRHLYRVCGNAQLHLEQWIISSRLEGARMEFSQTAAHSTTITTIARRWGFKDPTHFARRFRAAYGMLPSQWLRAAQQERGDNQDFVPRADG
jgi:AraC-like DNA-binding protein